MENGYYKTEKEITYNYVDVEHKDDKGNLLWISHEKQEIVNEKEVWVEYTQKELAEQEISKLLEWFEEYDRQVSQYNRCIRTGVGFDKDIIELDRQADINAKRITELRKEFNINNINY